MGTTEIGLAGAFLTTAAAVPQVLKAYRTRQVRDISVWQPVLLVAGMIFWLIYGVLLRDLPLITANSFSIACNLALVMMKIAYGRSGDEDIRMREMEQ